MKKGKGKLETFRTQSYSNTCILLIYHLVLCIIKKVYNTMAYWLV